MKIRIFKKLASGVFSVRIHTEDWSENDRLLMQQNGEPEINLGGTFSTDTGSSDSSSATASVTLPDVYAKILTESPFTQKFDSRDLGGCATAKEIAQKWASAAESRLASAVAVLRSKADTFTTEEITEY